MLINETCTESMRYVQKTNESNMKALHKTLFSVTLVVATEGYRRRRVANLQGCGRHWMYRSPGPGHYGVETVVGVGGVVHSADSTVGFHQGVLALHHIAVALFVLRFLVASVRVCHSVFELVFWIGLQEIQSWKKVSFWFFFVSKTWKLPSEFAWK